jgi:hypothetical protein
MQLGRYAEYYAKMEFASYGFEVYTSEVDDRGIDFVCRKDGKWFEVQVKAIRKYNYVFMRKEHMDIESRERLNCILRFEDGTLPEVYIIPATAWKTPTALLCGRDYEGGKSVPEWGINVSRRNMPLLRAFEASSQLAAICQST